jgi:hypothetical protein
VIFEDARDTVGARSGAASRRDRGPRLRADAALSQAAAGRDLVDAICGYESAMIDRGFAAVREGAANDQRFLGQDPVPVS